MKRLIHLSILKSENENGNEILLKLNQWIKQVKYNTFDNNDMLTSILIIIQYIKSVLLLPNIEFIINYTKSINIIINCIEKFDILTTDTNDQLITYLEHLHDENCSLKQIVYAYNILKQQFQNLSNQHLQLIKTALQCSFVTEIMKKSDLYSFHEYQRFQELRDNLTA
ncbi:unnamed protein product [Adineta steineri]|uniref:Uncharacterized protein n=1 Tax=Adineta steineri TaxID=433720 RepID=A0A813VVP5_9BILA|nr:unnamed protein product [Adineta steineri]